MGYPMKRVIEVTGVAGVGKSYIINKLMKKSDNIVLDIEIIDKYNLNDFYLFYLFFKVKNSFKIIKLIIKIAYELNMPLYNRVNFVRNSIKKVAKEYFLTHIYNEDRIVLVDEGISHLYQNIITTNRQNNPYILSLVNQIISNMRLSLEVVIVDASSDIIIKRLHQRGHGRVKNLEEIKTFVKQSKQNLIEMKKRFINSIEISNEKSIDEV